VTYRRRDFWTWTNVRRVIGVVLIFTVIILRATHLLLWQDAQFLFGIAAALLGVLALLRDSGRD
jgi:uncharacterized membrane protein YhaH (DUF805 family)